MEGRGEALLGAIIDISLRAVDKSLSHVTRATYAIAQASLYVALPLLSCLA